MRSPTGAESSLTLRPLAPGLYGARYAIESGSATPYRFELLESGGLSRVDVRGVGARALTYAWADEFRSELADVTMLKALSEATGGVFAPEAADIFRARGDGRSGWTPIWPWFIVAALVLFVADLAWRRLPWFR